MAEVAVGDDGGDDDDDGMESTCPVPHKLGS